jgi:hypothetical protein
VTGFEDLLNTFLDLPLGVKKQVAGLIFARLIGIPLRRDFNNLPAPVEAALGASRMGQLGVAATRAEGRVHRL